LGIISSGPHLRVGISDVGEQIYHFVDGSLDRTQDATCYDGCYFPTVVAMGDSEGLPITGVDLGADRIRKSAPKQVQKRSRFTFLWNWIGELRPKQSKKSVGKSPKKR
jgi:hypothetical protein